MYERRWLRPAEVAERLGCSRKTILNKISSGQILASHAPGLSVRVDWKALEEILEGGMRIAKKGTSQTKGAPYARFIRR
jgi:excisionase family DNA binding protein